MMAELRELNKVKECHQQVESETWLLQHTTKDVLLGTVREKSSSITSVNRLVN